MIILTASFITGCQPLFFRSIQGTSVNAGISLPSDGAIDLQIVSYLSGETISIKDKSNITYTYNSSVTNSYFGIITTQESRNGKIEVK